MISKHIDKLVRKGDLTKIENYNKAVADKTQLWECHHRLELTLDGEFAHSAEDLIRMDMYYHRPYFELIFLTPAEHRKIHSKTKKTRKGIKQDEETRKRISETLRNKSLSDFGKKYLAHFGYSISENTKQYNTELCWYRRHNKKCRWE